MELHWLPWRPTLLGRWVLQCLFHTVDNIHLTTLTRHAMVGITRSKVIYLSCAAVQDSSNCLGQLGGCLFARMFFFCRVAGMLLHLDIRCSLSLPFYLRSTRASHTNWRHDSDSILFSLILFYSPLRVAMRLPVSILIMSSSHACSSRYITIQTYSNRFVKCSWPKVPLGLSTKIQCAAKNILAVGCISPGHIRSCQDFNPGIL